MPGAVDVGLSTRGQKPELDVRVDRGLAGALGLRVGDIAQALRPAFAGVDVGDWVDPTGKTRDVTVRLAPEARARAADLSSLPLVVPDAEGRPTTVPLGQVATIKSVARPDPHRSPRSRARDLRAGQHRGPAALGRRRATSRRRSTRFRSAPGYSITQGGQTAEQQEVFTRILVSLVVGVLLMYLVLVVQFGSFLDPLAIMISLPLSLIGVVGALMLTGDTLNIMSLIGVILLMGIVAKNAILLIDFAKWSEEKGMPRREAIIEAGRARLRPILMTTLALIAGHDSGGARPRRRRGLPRAARPGHHRRRHHVHAADAARDPDVLRHPGRDARPRAAAVRPRAAGAIPSGNTCGWRRSRPVIDCRSVSRWHDASEPHRLRPTRSSGLRWSCPGFGGHR